MIQIKSKPKKPRTFVSKKPDAILKELRNGKAVETINDKIKVKKILLKHQNFKCCFCECHLDTETCEILLYRPFICKDSDDKEQQGRNKDTVSKLKQNKDSLKKYAIEVNPPYFWLACDWENFFASCKYCKEAKNDKFPLLPGSCRAKRPEDNLSKEKPFLIHPVFDNPEEYITFVYLEVGNLLFVKAKGVDEKARGSKTIKDLTAINRKELIKNRARILREIEQDYEMLMNAKNSENLEILERCYINIIKHTEKGVLFSGLRNEFIKEKGIEKELELIRNIIKNHPAQSKKTSHVGVATRVFIVKWLNEKITPEICEKYCKNKHILKANETLMIAIITDILSGFQLGIPIATCSVIFIKFFEIILDKRCECNEYAY